MPMTFSVCPGSEVTAVLIEIFFSALSSNESSFVLLAAPANACAPEIRSPWKMALVSAMPAVIVGTEGCAVWNFTTWNAGPFGPAARPVCGTAIVLSCW